MLERIQVGIGLISSVFSNIIIDSYLALSNG